MDLNADLAEGFGHWELGDDEAMLDVVTSANVACGFHAGDALTMRRVCAYARERGVAVGAQVGYRDLPGFGRRFIAYEHNQLRDELIYQIGALDALARTEGVRVAYVKPHGALYHATVHAEAIVDAVRDLDPKLPVLCSPGSVLATAASDAALKVIFEGFADRGYLPDGSLMPRSKAGAVVTDTEEVVARALLMATEQRVIAFEGTVIDLPVDSICLHGDTPGAVQLGLAVRAALTEAGVPLQRFTTV
ncbi:UPF0271 protein [Allocatelliglobosispora scoriae]|uniref:UPF0271 protein n=1 Tax=Allocatelliglobosispora scoriae TaxID=643052 RepID=A0A841BVC0_9ACTN|nr:5-oxoprolinase subunit PxpA [Allocatelliglobosispora scoriae]MBB5871109.1 UPF0271 protein [Allocatelliglobosispora scoriae]